ncbi:hypothetical protein GDO81_006192 [Engystomops pustulosus]|uniref:Uncharacterized protein n=1 Tax=Engystomops pustulosus TaxID=76066 RepID=A0AAV7CVU2_ENGPU|nr:hypothetical protein GDO81_006192 [Engystomops pustulosus]
METIIFIRAMYLLEAALKDIPGVSWRRMLGLCKVICHWCQNLLVSFNKECAYVLPFFHNSVCQNWSIRINGAVEPFAHVMHIGDAY